MDPWLPHPSTNGLGLDRQLSDTFLQRLDLPLAAGNADVWCLGNHVDEAEARRLTQVLSTDEQQRADRFLLSAARDRFVVTRAALRWLLSSYLKEDPRTLRFRYEEHGKPMLEERHTEHGWHFSVSHAHTLSLIAVARGGAVGVDIERIRDNVAYLELAQRFFPADDAARLRQLPEAEQRRAFFVYWSRREALAKASGKGLAQAARTGGAEVAGDTLVWRVADLSPPAEYTAAVAVFAEAQRVACYSLGLLA